MGTPRWPVDILLSLDFPFCTYLCFSLQPFSLLLSHEITIKNLDMGGSCLIRHWGLGVLPSSLYFDAYTPFLMWMGFIWRRIYFCTKQSSFFLLSNRSLSSLHDVPSSVKCIMCMLVGVFATLVAVSRSLRKFCAKPAWWCIVHLPAIAHMPWRLWRTLR